MLFFAGRYTFSFPNQYIFEYMFMQDWIHWLGWAAAIFCQMVASATIMPFNYLYMKKVVIRIVRLSVPEEPVTELTAEAE